MLPRTAKSQCRISNQMKARTRLTAAKIKHEIQTTDKRDRPIEINNLISLSGKTGKSQSNETYELNASDKC